MTRVPLFLRKKHMLQNQAEFNVKYNYLKFPASGESHRALLERERLLEILDSKHVHTGYKSSKLDVTKLSPGCQICGEGTWSCLFINGICNSRCFYCPAPQHEIGEPETNSLIFPEPADYSDYVKVFRFRGVSISGGEPLLTFDKSLSYIRTVRRNIGDDIHIWLYTNGKLFDSEKARILADAGLNEIRFDIGATDYSLDRLSEAIRIIPTVTVEIPAVPEDIDLMKGKIRELKNLGVDFLNLHQLRLTPFNFNQLIEKDYTFLHGEKVTVLESEMAALNLMLYEKLENIGLPINYCSFVYKNRFQKSAARRRHAAMVLKPWESITENGFIRVLRFYPKDSTLLEQLETKFGSNCRVDHSQRAIFINAKSIAELDMSEGLISVEYYVSQISPAPSELNIGEPVGLNEHREINIEKRTLRDETFLDVKKLELFFQLIQGKLSPELSIFPDLHRLQEFEIIAEGLQDYY